MATRRKYKAPGYRDGGRVPIPEGTGTERPAVAADVPAPPAEAVERAKPADDNPLQRALEATRRAEELQRQAATKQPVHDDVESWPISSRKKQFLRENPALMRSDIAPIAARHYHAALNAGITDDTPEIEKFIVENVAREIEHQRELTSAAARPTPENIAVREDVHNLDREAAELAAADAPPVPSPAPLPRRVPISAPVSRDSHMFSGQKSRSGQIHLTADEAFIARSSRPDLPAHEAELLYARNRDLMRGRKARGEIQADRG